MSNVAKEAEEHVRTWFRQRGQELERNPTRRGKGFDFRAPGGKIIEVKGCSKENIAEVRFFNLTKDEHDIVTRCKQDGKPYELHLVIGIAEGKTRRHYVFDATTILEMATQVISYSVPIGKKGVSALLREKRVTMEE